MSERPGLFQRLVKALYNPRPPSIVRAMRKGDLSDAEYPIPPAYILREATHFSLSGDLEVPTAPKELLDEFERALWVNTCVTGKARSAANVPWLLKRRIKGKEDEVVADHPLIDMLRSPAPKFTWQDMIYLVVCHLELCGAAFLEKIRKDGAVVGLRVLNPVYVSYKTKAREGIVEYTYRPNVQPIKFEPEGIVHLRYIDPAHDFRGISPLIAGFQASRLDGVTQLWNIQFFKRGAHPDTILQTDKPVPPAERKRIKEEFLSTHGGPNKGRGVAMLPYGLKAEEFGNTHREMQFSELRHNTRDEIHAVFHVPPVVSGILDQASYANAYAQLEIFRDQTLLPLIGEIFATFEHSLIPEFEVEGEDLFLSADLEKMRFPDERSRLQQEALALLAAGVMDVDEVRAKVGLPPRTPEQIARQTQQQQQASEEKAQNLEQVREKEQAEAESEPKPRIGQQKAYRPLTPVRLVKAMHTIEETVAHVCEEKIEAMLRQQLTDLDRWLLKNEWPLAKSAFSESQVLKLLASRAFTDADAVPFAKAGEDFISGYIETGGRRYHAEPTSVNVPKPPSPKVQASLLASDIAKKRLKQLKRHMDEKTAKEASETIQNGIDEGRSVKAIADELARGKTFEKNRAKRIARTEVHSLMQEALFEGMQASGTVKKSVWITMEDDRVRDTHAKAHGQTRKLGKRFRVGGEWLRYPGDGNASAENRINCRCILAPVVEKSAKDTSWLQVSSPEGHDPMFKVLQAATELPMSYTGGLRLGDVAPVVAMTKGHEDGALVLGANSDTYDAGTLLIRHIAKSLLADEWEEYLDQVNKIAPFETRTPEFAAEVLAESFDGWSRVGIGTAHHTVVGNQTDPAGSLAPWHAGLTDDQKQALNRLARGWWAYYESDLIGMVRHDEDQDAPIEDASRVQ